MTTTPPVPSTDNCPDWCPGWEPTDPHDTGDPTRSQLGILHVTRGQNGHPLLAVALGRTDDLDTGQPGHTGVSLRLADEPLARTITSTDPADELGVARPRRVPRPSRSVRRRRRCESVGTLRTRRTPRVCRLPGPRRMRRPRPPPATDLGNLGRRALGQTRRTRTTPKRWGAWASIWLRRRSGSIRASARPHGSRSSEWRSSPGQRSDTGVLGRVGTHRL